MQRPLDGTLVVDLTRYLPGAFATAELHRLGARVVRLEQPGGDPMRGTSPDWQDGLTIIAMGESGGRQDAVNRWDVNAREGHPTGGLMQFRDDTFARYAMPGYQVFMNPVD